MDGEAFVLWQRALGERVAAARWRLLLWLSGERDWGRDWCLASPLLCTPQTRWLGEAAPEPWRSLRPADARALLGTECAHLVVDAWSGFHPNAVGALAGTVRAGGLLVLMTPPPERWPGYPDPDYRRMAVAGFPVRGRALFLEHLVRSLQRDAGVMHVRQGAPLPALPSLPPAAGAVPRPAECLTCDQSDAVQAIERVVNGHRDRPLVLSADRGRGKTAALGIAAARLLAAGAESIVVTAPLLGNVAPLFERALALLPGAVSGSGRLCWQGRVLRFVSPDALLRELPAARLLLVDEAAAIPTPLLSRMLDHYHRIVFTTTVHGYEGTGRGFALRFQRELDRRRPQWLARTLSEPVRWAAGDPLEATVRRLLWLQAELPVPMRGAGQAATECHIEEVVRDRLLDEPELMQQLVGLLTLAHYRTTPDDCRVLMDAPNVRVAVLKCGGNVVGTLLVALDGPLPTALAEAVVAGRRRPRGHLLPQALHAQTGSAALLEQAGARVVRIAVHPALQRRALGARMLAWLERWAGAQGLDYLGASFGARPELLPFWRAAGFTPVALGLRRDASSGEHSLLVLRGLSPHAAAVVAAERQRFAVLLPWHLAAALRELETPLVAQLLAQLPCAATLDDRDRTDLHGFMEAARDAEHCALALHRAARVLLADAGAAHSLSTAEAALLIARLLQRRDWQDAARVSQLSGRGQGVAVLRAVLGRYRGLLLGDQRQAGPT